MKEEEMTPLLYIEVPGTFENSETVLFYGHFDK